MENRDAFMLNIARQLGREPRRIPQPLPTTHAAPLRSRYAEKIAQQPCDSFMAFAAQVMQAHCERASLTTLPQVAERLCKHYGGGPVLISGDARLVNAGITAHLQKTFPTHCWASPGREDNLRNAAAANIGVVFAEYGLCETGGVVLFSSPLQGRAISLLPPTTLFVIYKSRLLAGVTQLAEILRQRLQSGETLPSCINLIAGPSSTADIELIKVVGVHGPLNAVYLIIEDC
ncbi:lactate utilization protein C [Phytobacter diazotrophicus]|uniref:LutC/YkgG family protein n=1 Tax=Phytobacter diazotrophicus TaxID=395631 RepID=UPI0013ECAE3E|nr:lactate utilization protein C [Phytobacter diazotrophicus]MDU7130785.1 lactate utilization protein C [Enterobacteriaceae bacterium]QIH63849.1 lactate utilization protein C [Enterobacteriaceae bacterium A-F18]